jgi:hypothetical protein
MTIFIYFAIGLLTLLLTLSFIWMGIMVVSILMWKHNKTNRFIEWFYRIMNKPVKQTKFEIILWNFVLTGVLLFIVGCVGCISVYNIRFTINGFILICIFLMMVLGGELRTVVFFDKYFIRKDFEYHPPQKEFDSPLITYRNMTLL